MYHVSHNRWWCISIHAPREGGDPILGICVLLCAISIHAPREGGDGYDIIDATSINIISIHAPREGGDARFTSRRT